MRLTAEEIRRCVAIGEIAAISVDTSIFDRNQRNLGSGLLKQMEQFRAGDLRFVLSAVVRRELEAHLVDEAKGAEAALSKALEEVAKAYAADAVDPVAETSRLTGGRKPEEVARDRLTAFLESTGAIVLDPNSDGIVKQLLDAYFDVQPPFESGKKKYEFPDALALLSIEAWARSKGIKVLVVSGDKGWLRFCEKSECLVPIANLGEALTLFQKPTALGATRTVLERLTGDHLQDLTDSIKKELDARIDYMTFHVDADSELRCEQEGVSASVLYFSIVQVGGAPDFEPVSLEGDQLTVRLEVTATLEIVAEFSFFAWDGVDREYVPMGTGEATREKEARLTLLATLGGVFGGDIAIESVELLPSELSVRFGEVEPKWMRDGGRD
jgi:hypothetical protein